MAREAGSKVITSDDLAAMSPAMRKLYEFYARSEAASRLDFSYDCATETLSYVVREGAGMCDFCGERSGPYSIWDADDITQLTGDQTGDGIPQVSTGAWHACIDCTPLVAAADREALLQRAIRILSAHDPADRQRLYAEGISLSHRSFWKAKR